MCALTENKSWVGIFAWTSIDAHVLLQLAISCRYRIIIIEPTTRIVAALEYVQSKAGYNVARSSLVH